MKKLLTLIILIITIKSIAQDKAKLDSLWMVYKQAKHDTTRIKLYHNIGYVYKHEKPDTAIFFYQKALNLAEKASQNLKGFKNLSGLEARFLSLQATSLNNIGIINAEKGDYDKAIEFFFKSLKIEEESGDKNGMADSYNNIGNIHTRKGDYDKAVEFYFKSLKIYEELCSLSKVEGKNGMASSYHNIGNIHYYKGDYDKAIEFYFKSLKIKEELGDKKGMAMSYNNIGLIHSNKGNYDHALEFFFKSLKIDEELGDKNGMANSYNNIGVIHHDKGNYDQSLEFYFKSLKICEELSDKNGMASSYNNIGGIHYEKGNYDKSLEFCFKSLKIHEELGDKNGMASFYNNIGILYLKQGKSKEAKKQQLLALNFAIEIGAKQQMYLAYSSLAQCDSALGNFKGAYEYHKLYSQVHDSVFTKESSDKIAEMGAKYEAEKRELTIQKLEKEKLLQDETLARKEAESKKQRIIIMFVVCSLLLVVVFSVFLFRLFVQKKMANAILQQQKEEISAQRDEIETQRDLVTHQKEHIEEIHKEVTDSINYAKRIQEAMLPVLSPNLTGLENLSGFSDLALAPATLPKFQTLAKFNPETFILFRPKDIVSGDFYWFSKVNDYQIYAVADCTGHGVPGAFMSMLGISFLNEIVRKKEVTQASHVLDQLRVSIIDALRQTGGSGTQKDGMDMSLVVIKSQDSNSKFQIPSSKFQENDEQLNIRTFEQSNQEPSEDLTQASLQRSDMFIEKKSDTNLVAITNDNQGGQIPCDSKTNNKQYYHAQWAGANNPLWVVRCSKNLTGFENLSGLGDEACQVKTPDRCSVGLGEDASANTSTGTVHSDEQQTTNNKLFEFKPDKMPIAIYERMYIFTNHEIELSKGDTIYLMSDGYEDQFGGPKGKKFLSKNLKELIIANCLLTMEEQKQVLEKTMIEWIGVGEQIDDITVLGIKI